MNEQEQEFGVARGLDATSPFVHFVCVNCKATARMPAKGAHRPRTWGHITMGTSIANGTLLVCGKCLADCPLLMKFAERIYADMVEADESDARFWAAEREAQKQELLEALESYADR